MQPNIISVFEKQTSTWQYIVACSQTREAVIIDPVLDFDVATLQITTTSADNLLDIAASNNYTVVKLLETHVHADHLTAAYYIQQKLFACNNRHVPICIGHRIRQVQQTFARRYNVSRQELDQAFDCLFNDDEDFLIGNISAQAIYLPGHTPDHSGYIIGNSVFVGDSIFNPDVGTARCDFPNGDATTLYHSMQKLLSLPLDFKLYTGHDYPPSDTGREPMPYVTVRQQREANKHIKDGTSKDEFIKWRTERDASLNEPRLLHQALQVNIRGGRMPPGWGGSKRSFFLMPVQLPGLLC